MAITNIGTLQDAAESWTERTFTDSVFLEWANAAARKLMNGMLSPDGRSWIVQPLRYRRMETTTTLTTSSASVAVPADWLEFKRVWIDANDGKDLIYRPLTQFRSIPESQQTGTPLYYTIDAGNIYVAPTSDADLEVTYYQTLGAFTGDSSTDAVLTYNPEVYLSGVLVEAYRWMRDPEGMAMEQIEFSAKVRGLNGQDQQALTSGSLLVAMPGIVA